MSTRQSQASPFRGTRNRRDIKSTIEWTGTGQVAPNFQSPPLRSSSLRHRPHRPGLDELGVDHRLAGVFLPVAEIRGHIAADQGDILRHPQTPIEQELGDGSAYRKH
ncbi:hypothetical protein N9A93_00615 [Akkermansiaceae bacterium]|nr:hypothetical protein [Akkermansiaceae bacterium]